MKRVKDCKDVSIMSPQDEHWTVKTDKFTLFVYCNFLVLLSKTFCSQNINKQNVNIADEILTDYSFLSRYHYTKSKNYLKRQYRIRHWIPMFFGTPCSYPCLVPNHDFPSELKTTNFVSLIDSPKNQPIWSSYLSSYAYI